MKKIISAIIALAMALTSFASVAVMTASADEVIKVACVGDSITDNGKSVFSYPSQLQKMLGDGYDVRNFGYGGTTAMKDGAPLSYWGRSEYTDSKNFQPDIVIFMLGTNDAAGDNQERAKDHFKADYKELISNYIGLASNPTVYVATAPYTRDEPRKTGVSSIIIPAQLEVAAELSLPVINTFAATSEFSSYFTDGLHPNTPGYYLLAQVFYKEIFEGTVYNVTVKAEPGATVSLEGYSVTAGADGLATIPAAAGEREFTVNLVGYGSAKKTVTIDGDITVDLTEGFDAVQNLALNATAFDELGGRQHYEASRTPDKLNDGNVDTSWQANGSPSNPITNLWVGFDFGEPTKFDQAILWWEEATACTLPDGYEIQYSDDGENYTPVANMIATRANAVDTCNFDAVTARYIRFVLKNGSSGKALPQLFEIEVYNTKAGEDIDPPVDPKPTLAKGDVNGDGIINSTDFMQIRRYYLGIFTFTDDQLIAGDVNEDGKVNSTDFMRVRAHFLGLYNLYEE